jgi:4a-hydroxytetrahydrobiopterin dehydratase
VVQALDGPALVVALGTLPGWAIEDGKLRRSFIFEIFDDAMAFINQVAGLARQHNHHPEWSNVYNKYTSR